METGNKDDWMPIPAGLTNHSPPGLEYLSTIDQLLINRERDHMALVSTIANKFTLKNSVGQKVYQLVEISGEVTRELQGNSRSFEMQIMDRSQHEVIHLKRPSALDCCWLPTRCLQSMEVSAPPGTVIGSVRQKSSFIKTVFHIKNASGEVVLIIKGPACSLGDTFNVYSKDSKTKVGTIMNKWTGLMQAVLDENCFGVSFPMDLDVTIKAVMIGACILIDYIHYEPAPSWSS